LKPRHFIPTFGKAHRKSRRLNGARGVARGVREPRFRGLDDTNLTEGGLLSKESDPTCGFFDTLQSKHVERRATAVRRAEAHERRDRGSTGPRPVGSRPRRGKVRRGSAADDRVTPARVNGSTGCSKSLELRATRKCRRFRAQARADAGTARGTRSVVRQVWLPVGGNLWRQKTHERHRHETRPEGSRAEESAKRPRKPEGVA
jgi:hypothetical protein